MTNSPIPRRPPRFAPHIPQAAIITQVSDRFGPSLVYPLGYSWRHHLSLLLFLFGFSFVTMVITSYSLLVLYANNPDFGQDLEMKKAFCEEINETFVTTEYQLAQTPDGLICKPVEMEAKR
jgi:hypothetical protein